MFVVMLNYVKPLEEIDALIPEHVEYLKQNYAKGVFLASGRKIPRTGGVILARAKSLDALMDILHADPFHREGVVEYEVTEFSATMVAEGLELLKDAAV